ncbi:MAG: hypothetical protein V4641_22195, partial [Pseudomonadota bacterium]
MKRIPLVVYCSSATFYSGCSISQNIKQTTHGDSMKKTLLAAGILAGAALAPAHAAFNAADT